MRLQKFLAEAGIASRRKCEELIKRGEVRVNGKKAALAETIDPEGDVVLVQGKRIQKSAFHYVALNKPKGVLSSASDPQNRRTVLDLVKHPARVFPVGRLDKDSEGLVLLTNDGDLAYALTHPKFGVEKVYEVIVSGLPSKEVLRKVQTGILLDDGLTAPCKVRIVEIYRGKKNARLEIKIHEGRKRELRRMFGAVGHPVISLRRTAIGPLQLALLPSGRHRPLHPEEITQLMKLKARNTP